MGNDLDGAAQVIAAALLADDRFVDLPRGEIIILGRARMHETLVMPQVEVGLAAVLGDEDLAVLERAHGARIDIDIGVKLDERGLDATRFQKRAQRCGSNALTQRGHHPAGHKYETRHDGTGACYEPGIHATKSAACHPNFSTPNTRRKLARRVSATRPDCRSSPICARLAVKALTIRTR